MQRRHWVSVAAVFCAVVGLTGCGGGGGSGGGGGGGGGRPQAGAASGQPQLPAAAEAPVVLRAGGSESVSEWDMPPEPGFLPLDLVPASQDLGDGPSQFLTSGDPTGEAARYGAANPEPVSAALLALAGGAALIAMRRRGRRNGRMMD